MAESSDDNASELSEFDLEKEFETEAIDNSENESANYAKDDAESDSENEGDHAEALKRLKTKDPDFYKFLEENEKELLNFKGSDDEVDEASCDEDKSKPQVLSDSKLNYIKENIKKSRNIKICKELISAFKNAVRQAEGSGTKSDMSNSDLFNSIVKLCLIELVPALNRILEVSCEGNKSFDPSKSKKWAKCKVIIKSYLTDLIKLLSTMQESAFLVVLLKHVIHLVPYYTRFESLSRSLLKKIVSFWCGNEETVRVLSLIIIVRTTKVMPKDCLNNVLKSMYFAFVKNTKFTSPTTWPMINFMKRSLTEVYALSPEVAYEHAFIYIRQLAIHLRNALTTKSKESFKTVYNWQYVHCLFLWSHLLSRLYHHDAVKSLVYPLVQTVLGTINLIPTARYMPLRFHLIKSLMQISRETDSFIPVLPLILDVLTIINFNKKSNFSVKAVDFSCCLKVTKSQLLEAGFKNSCITEVSELLCNYFETYSHSIGFPELALPAVLQVKQFMKQCKISKYNHMLKEVLVKIEENSSFISLNRQSVNFHITDTDEIRKWEQLQLSKKTPLLLKQQKKTLGEISCKQEVSKDEICRPKRKMDEGEVSMSEMNGVSFYRKEKTVQVISHNQGTEKDEVFRPKKKKMKFQKTAQETSFKQEVNKGEVFRPKKKMKWQNRIVQGVSHKSQNDKVEIFRHKKKKNKAGSVGKEWKLQKKMQHETSHGQKMDKDVISRPNKKMNAVSFGKKKKKLNCILNDN